MLNLGREELGQETVKTCFEVGAFTQKVCRTCSSVLRTPMLYRESWVVPLEIYTLNNCRFINPLMSNVPPVSIYKFSAFCPQSVFVCSVWFSQ
jgi:hypothetical protein